jgi:hypothetical protein
VIDEAACGGRPLVVTAGCIPILLVFRDDLAAAIETVRCTGVLFRSPEAWTDTAYP